MNYSNENGWGGGRGGEGEGGGNQVSSQELIDSPKQLCLKPVRVHVEAKQWPVSHQEV